MVILSHLCKTTKSATVLRSKDVFTRIMTHFPHKNNLALCIAYGSGVFKQKGHDNVESNMLDFVFIVKDSLRWHSDNLVYNGKHYSSIMRLLGPHRITDVQKNYGAGCYYNTLVPCEDRVIKYGVVDVNQAIKDLNDWKHLYIAGRMHKPVSIIQHNFESHALLYKAIETNLISAVLTAFLMLPDKFSETTLYLTIAGLSYTGDFRMKFGEDKHKVRNIVTPNFSRFQDLYHPILNKLQESEHGGYFEWKKETFTIEQDVSARARHFNLKHLPIKIQQRIAREFDKDAKQIRDLDEIIRSIARYSDIDNVITASLAETIRRSSKNQSIKGILTAGVGKSIRYSFSKVKKMTKSLYIK